MSQQIQRVNESLIELGKKKASLFAFFSAMPKGGDLHHHYSGSVYAETYADYVISKDYYLNLKTLEVKKEIDDTTVISTSEWKKFSQINNLEEVKADLVRKWSIKDFDHGHSNMSSADHFFTTFSDFSVASRDTLEEGLAELKNRALLQNLSYLETIFYRINWKDAQLKNEEQVDKELLNFQKNKDANGLFEYLDGLHNNLKPKIDSITDLHNKNVKELHNKVVPDTDNLIVRYQNYCLRFRQPTDMFIELMSCFNSAEKSDLLIGANIVAPEHGETSMRDYWLHMYYYKFLRSKYKNVKFSVHAGELTLGLVRPELLGKHIKEAIDIAKPKRIGHGLDIIYDSDFTNTIKKLSNSNTAIEINLTSNEFILNVVDDLHPIEVYHNYKIPMVICTDDEGVLRSSITEQYVLLRHRYELSYMDIKELVYNSIKYSLIEEEDIKQKLLDKLDRDFDEFEKKIPELEPLFILGK
ncbi:adenosine deaminase [Christiangramia sp. SM2212]|uniref:adenosine deaminase n=1 Tax=Christiangramia sediminicola TaxID=3073267 RepID=A0ABU1ESI6_9FLAO|nr:adenosine deaminase [Christiangramia sp. SM2212]MDR5591133.1 adenosine deaminase [Christiangramia sp. SM2212]